MTEPGVDPVEISKAVRRDDKDDRDADLAEEMAKTAKLAEDLAARGDTD